MDMSTPAVLVNAKLLRANVGKIVRAAIQVTNCAKGSVYGKSTDGEELVITGNPTSILSTYIEVVGIAESENSIRAGIWNNCGENFNMENYDKACELANKKEYKHLFSSAPE